VTSNGPNAALIRALAAALLVALLLTAALFSSRSGLKPVRSTLMDLDEPAEGLAATKR
jgi:hypothetical protein